MGHENQLERRAMLLGLTVSTFGGVAFAQSTGRILEDLARAALARSQGTTPKLSYPIQSNGGRGGSGLSFGDADGGIREALGRAALASALRLGRVDGYWADGKVRIPLPRPLDGLQSRLRPLNLSTPLDNFQLRLNRAAEMAAPRAGTIFMDAIRSVSLNDAIQIVRGGDTAGTDMLKSRATTQLSALMTPPMSQAVDASGAGAALDRINARYGREIQRLGSLSGLRNYTSPASTDLLSAQAISSPLIFGANATANGASSRSNPVIAGAQPETLKSQMIGFAVSRALDGLFFYVGEEERAIRRDPAKRTTELLRRVFGGL